MFLSICAIALSKSEYNRWTCDHVFIQYIPRNMHTVFTLLCFVVVIHWLISPYPSGLLHWHCGNLTIAPVPAKQPWWKWINTSYEFIMNDCITTTKQSTTKPCGYFLGYTVCLLNYISLSVTHIGTECSFVVLFWYLLVFFLEFITCDVDFKYRGVNVNRYIGSKWAHI